MHKNQMMDADEDDGDDVRMNVDDYVCGKGTYGTVRRDANDSSIVVKHVTWEPGRSYGIPLSVYREITLFNHLPHCKFVIRPKEVKQIDQSSVSIIYNYAPCDLSHVIDHGMSLKATRVVMRHILTAVSFLHSHGIMHRDIKPDNILISKEGTALLSDFSLARFFKNPPHSLISDGPVVTPPYRAPEILLGEDNYTEKIDIWSIGCILVECLIGEQAFVPTGSTDELGCILHTLGVPSEASWPRLRELEKWSLVKRGLSSRRRKYHPTRNNLMKQLTSCIRGTGKEKVTIEFASKLLAYNPEDRFSAKEALQHEFIQVEENIWNVLNICVLRGRSKLYQ